MADYVTMEDLAEVLKEQMAGLPPKEYQYYHNLKNRRTILFNDIVDDMVVEKIILPLREFEEDDDQTTPVTLILNTPGGSLADGLILNNIIDTYKKPLNIIVYGYSCSMGTILLCAGNHNPNVTKKCYPFSFFLFHPGRINIDDGAAAVNDYMDYQKKVDNKIKEYVVNGTNITEEEYDKHQRLEWYLTADEAKRLGLIDVIIGVDESVH